MQGHLITSWVKLNWTPIYFCTFSLIEIDWLPTIVEAIGDAPLAPNETLPLDGISLWSALTTPGGNSPRTSVYYGISQTNEGPAVRTVDGMKVL